MSPNDMPRTPPNGDSNLRGRLDRLVFRLFDRIERDGVLIEYDDGTEEAHPLLLPLAALVDAGTALRAHRLNQRRVPE